MGRSKLHRLKGDDEEWISTQEALVRSAVELFSARSYSATSVQDIASHAGVAKGNFYHYFSAKEDVLDFILNRFLDDLQVRLESARSSAGSPRIILTAYISWLLGVVEHDRKQVAIFVQERRRLSDLRFGEVLRKGDVLADSFVEVLEEGAATKEFRTLPEARLMAFGLIGMCTWAYQWYRPDHMDLNAVAQMYAAVIVDGLRVNKSLPQGARRTPSFATKIALPTAGDTTRENLLRAAVQLFYARGYANTSLNNVAEHAHVTTGAIYSNFAHKEALLRDIIDQFLDQLITSIEHVLDEPQTSSEALAGLIAELMETVGDRQAYLTIFLQEWRFFEAHSFADVRKKSARLVGLFTDVITRGQQEKEFRKVASARVLAYGIIGMCVWAYQWCDPGVVAANEGSKMYAETVLSGLLYAEQNDYIRYLNG
jgi:TetR/AcrR family transcriptional regulator, cholesterol catabolism regulator